MTSKRKQRGWIGAAIGAGASLLGGMMASEGQEDTNQSNMGLNNAQMAFNQMEAERNRTFQAQMRESQYQTTMSDMYRAGLNPMLAMHKGGAGTPAGATASAGSMIPMTNEKQAMLNGAMAAAQIANVQSQTDVNKAQKDKIEAEVPLTVANTGQVTQNIENLKKTVDKMTEEIKQIKMQTLTEEERVALTRQEVILRQIDQDLRKGQITNTEADTKLKQVNNTLLNYEVPKAKGEASYFEKAGGVAPALKDLGAIINGAAAMRRGR